MSLLSRLEPECNLARARNGFFFFSQIGAMVSFGALFSVPLADGVKADQLRCVLVFRNLHR